MTNSINRPTLRNRRARVWKPGSQLRPGFEQIREHHDRLSSLLVRLAEIEGFEPALDEVLTAALDLVKADAGYIRLFDNPGELSSYVFVVQRGFTQEYIDYFASLASPVDSNARLRLAQGNRIIIEDMATYPAFQPHLSYVLAEGYTSMQATPLVNRAGVAIGAIITCFVKRHTPAEEDLHLLDIYAKLAAAPSSGRSGSRSRPGPSRRCEQRFRRRTSSWDTFPTSCVPR
jgi:hypothetical protein